MKTRVIDRMVRGRLYWFLQKLVDGKWVDMQRFIDIDSAVSRLMRILDGLEQ